MRVLFFIPTFSSGGAEAFIVNLIENLDREKYILELLCIDAVPGVYDERLKKINVKMHMLVNEIVVNPVKRYIKAYKAFEHFITDNKGKYDVIHFNIAQGEELPFIHMAKKFEVPIRILHSHNSSVNSKLKYIGHVICKVTFCDDVTDYLACSDIAAKWLLPPKVFYHKKYRVIKNGIEVEKYQFSEDQRFKKRKELQLGNKPVFLNIGRLNHQKNQSFLIEVFQIIRQMLPNALLLVAGEGDLREELEKKTFEYSLQDSIYWIGNRNDVPSLLSAADVFLLPSLFEGLPYTIIEAQASGIRCVISDTISEECVVTDLVERIGLSTTPYAEFAVAQYNQQHLGREKYAQIVREAGYDISNTIKEMDEIYSGWTKE